MKSLENWKIDFIEDYLRLKYIVSPYLVEKYELIFGNDFSFVCHVWLQHFQLFKNFEELCDRTLKLKPLENQKIDFTGDYLRLKYIVSPYLVQKYELIFGNDLSFVSHIWLQYFQLFQNFEGLCDRTLKLKPLENQKTDFTGDYLRLKYKVSPYLVQKYELILGNDLSFVTVIFGSSIPLLLCINRMETLKNISA